MSTLVAAAAINRLLPYRGQQLDLPTDSGYIEFNNPTVQAFNNEWTKGADAQLEVSTEGFDGDDAMQLSWGGVALTNSTDLYVEDTAGNVDASLPCTLRVIAKGSSTGWFRIFDPNDAGTDVWIDTTNRSIGTVGVDVLDARITFPPRAGMVPGNGDQPGEHNQFFLVEMELPATAARTMRIQLVDGDGATVVNGTPVLQLYDPKVLNGKVRRWISRRTGLVLGQDTPANQPWARPMGVRELNGRQAIRFDSSKFTQLVSEDSAALWGYIHKGTGASINLGFLPVSGGSGNQVLFTTRSTSGGVGCTCVYDATADRLEVTVEDSLGAEIVSENTATSLVPNALYCVSLRFQDNGAEDFAASVGSESLSVADVDYSDADADPGLSFRIGANYDGYIGDISVANERWSDDEDDRAIEHLEATLASNASIPGCVLSVRAGERQVGDPVTLWGDGSTAGNDVTPVSGNEPAAETTSIELRGSPAVAFDESDYARANEITAAIPDLTADHAVITTLQVRALPVSGLDIIWKFGLVASTDNEIFKVTPGNWGWERNSDAGSFDGALSGTSDTLPHTHSFVIESGTRSAYIDGAALFEATASTPGTMGSDRFTIGADRFGSLGSSIRVSDFAVYDQAPNTYQRQLVERAQRRRMFGGRPFISGHSLPDEIGGEAESSLPLPSYQTGLVDAWLPGYGVTLGAGGVASWTSQVGTFRVISQSTTANQPDQSLADVDVNGLDVLTFVAANPDFLDSEDLASVWAFLHAHAGASVYVLLHPTGTAAAHTSFATARINTGVWLYYDGGNQRARFSFEDQSANNVNTPNPNLSDPVNTTHMFSHRFGEGASPELVVASENASATNDFAAWVDGGNPEDTLRVGDRVGTGDWPMEGKIAAILVYDHKLSDSNDTIVRDWGEALGGIP